MRMSTLILNLITLQFLRFDLIPYDFQRLTVEPAVNWIHHLELVLISSEYH